MTKKTVRRSPRPAKTAPATQADESQTRVFRATFAEMEAFVDRIRAERVAGSTAPATSAASGVDLVASNLAIADVTLTEAVDLIVDSWGQQGSLEPDNVLWTLALLRDVGRHLAVAKGIVDDRVVHAPLALVRGAS